ncbi:cyclase family protein [Bradyrhizobium manausense]
MTKIASSKTDPASTRDSLTLEDLHASAERNKQWGRWGPHDEIGTLNNVTSTMIVDAAKLIRYGKSFGLAMNYDASGPQRPVPGSKRFNPVHTFFVTGTDCCSNMGEFREIRGADDMVTMPLQAGTQWDALSHIFYYDKMWNGYDARLVGTEGARKCGIEKTRDRIVGRGVLLDIPRHLGMPWLPDGFGIGIDLLEACASAQHVKVGPGDFLIVRTGQMERCLVEGWGTFAGGDAPGMKFETADWCRTKNIAAIATDTWGVEVRPNEVERAFQPWHWVVIPMIGLTLGEMFYLKELAQDCANDKVYEFFFVGASLPFTGAVGCPLNPMAIK